MSAQFIIPDWMLPAEPEPVEVDPHRVESLVNRFIAAKQDALFTAPDAYYRTTGADAVDGAPDILGRLNRLRSATLDHARDDGERAALGERLDAHIAEASGGIDRHVAAQRDAFNRQTLAERQRLIRRAAELEHDNDNKLAGLAEANAGPAAELARMNGQPVDPAIATARSAIWRAAIDQRIANGKAAQALSLFDRVEDQLTPADRLSLDTPVKAARDDQLADQWIDRENKTGGPPLQQRLELDHDLPSEVERIVRAKIDARDSAHESARAAKVKALDDEMRDVFRILPTNPEAYRPGTLAGLADAYAATGEPQKAAEACQLALQEPFLRAFAQASPDRQHKLIGSLPAKDRPAAEAIQRAQSDALAQDSPRPSTALNSVVSSPSPFKAADDDIETERMLDAIYAVDQPGHTSESPDAEEAHGLLHQVQAVGDNKRQGDAGEDAEVARLKKIDPEAKIARQVRVYVAGGPDYMVADIIFRGNGIAVVNIVEVKTGSGVLSDNQVKALAEAARTGGVYITNVKAAVELGVEPNIPFGARKIIPEVYVSGGDSAKIERQLRNAGVDVRPAGVRGRIRIVGPPL